MSTSPTRHIVVDDTNPGIQYLGPGWSTSGGAGATEDRFGLVYNGTHHGVNDTSGSSILFQFSGTSVQLYGGIDNRGDTSIPSWQCFIDRQLISQTVTPGTTVKQLTLCQADSLPDGPHQVVVNVTTAGPTFWFDDYVFTPSPSVPFANPVIRVDNDDSDISLTGSGWTRYEDLWPLTSTSGDQMIFRFFGSSATFVGVAPGELNGNSTIGTYTIDGSSSTSFIIPGHDHLEELNQMYFSTPGLPLGSHVLTITYEGDASKAPLALEFFYVANGTGALSLPTLPTSSTPASMLYQPPPILPLVVPSSSGAQAYSHSGRSNHAGAIAAGVVAGLVLVVAAISAFFLRLRRRAKAMEWTYRADPFTETYDARRPTSHHAGSRKLGSSERLLGSGMTIVPAENRNSFFRPLRYGEIAKPPPSRRRPLPSLPPPPPVTSPSRTFRSSLLPAGLHFVHHKDSGIRINDAARVIDVPPTYTRE